MTKILYIGHYKENSDWSHVALNNIRAIHNCGIDIVCRHIPASNIQYKVDEDILAIENNDLSNITHCIQHVLPNYLTGTTIFKKNIAYCNLEQQYIKKNVYHSFFNLMDEVWAPNKDIVNNMKLCIDKPVRYVPTTYHNGDYSIDCETVSIGVLQKYYKFYFIGDLDDRQNISGLIRNFLLAFDMSDQVVLILNITVPHKSQKQIAEQTLSNTIDQIKQDLKIYKTDKYPIIKFIIHDSKDVTKHLLYSMHKSFDCYVSLSHAESWGTNIFDAMKFGKHPIVCNHGGPKEYIDSSDSSYGKLVNGTMQYAKHGSLPSNYMWFVPNDNEVIYAMQYYYNNRDKYINSNIDTSNFDINTVGNIIRNAINE